MATPKKAMTKAEIVTYFAEKFTVSKKIANDFLDEYAALAAAQTKKVGSFTMPGVGKTSKQKRKARKGRNPATGEEIKISAKTVVKIKVAKAFQDAVIPPKN